VTARTVALFGCGHIGGSLVLALRRAGLCAWVRGYDRDPSRASAAQRLGILDEVATSSQQAAAGAELALLAVPVRSIVEVAGAVATALPPDCLVHDVGSTKARILAEMEAVLPQPNRFVGGHPLAGLERTGPDAADPELFRGRVAFLTPSERTDPAALQAVEGLWRAVGAQPVRMSATRHDAVMAAVSHLPHAVAYALTSAIGAFGPEACGLTSGGFRDTTRIASSDPVMWRDIFLDNRAPVLDMLDRFREHLDRLRGLIAQGDGPGLERELGRIRSERAKILG
jgi:prephenate dehydrogenase